MKVLTRILVTAMAIAAFSCSTKEVFIPGQYQKDYITFGNGGGFTGAVTEFYILADGRVFKSNSSDGSPELIGNMDKKLITQQFETYENQNFNELTINNPGNIYFFLSFNNSSPRLTWGGDHQKVPEVLSTFHNNLTKLVKKLTEKSSKK